MVQRLSSNSTLIVTRTPLRVSFAGGGTDLPAFFEREFGAVLSMAIDRYVYVTVKRHSPLFSEPIRLNYFQSEQVERVDQIKNNIVRECMRFLEIEPPIYISTVADVPASTGLGGSSAFAVGLLNALHAYRGERVSAGQLAEEACHIEIERLQEPIGKQDQYAAAFGGMNLFCFKPSGGVTVEHERGNHANLTQLGGSLLLFWTGHQRDASGVLAEQKKNTGDKMPYLRRMRDQALELYDVLNNGSFDIRTFGERLDEGWRLKRRLASAISNDHLDRWYESALAAGATGGRLCGAGSGGFLLFVAPPHKHAAVRDALPDLTEMPIGYESLGSRLTVPFNN